MRKKEHVVLPKDEQPKVLGIFVKDRQFYATFVPLVIIISLQSLAALSVNLVDNIMLGSYTQTALSAATIANQIQYILQFVAGSMGIGIMILAAQYWGKQEIDPIKKIISLGVKFAVAIGIVFLLAALIFPYQLMGLFTDDMAIIEESVQYLLIVCWSYLFFVVSNSLMKALQGVESAMIGTVMSLSTVILNGILNYILIFGNFGAPELGIIGAGIATLVARIVELIIVLVYLRCMDRKLNMRIRELFAFSTEYMHDFITVSTPVLLSGALWGVAMAAHMVILGHINSDVIAASSIATVVNEMLTIVGFASANAASVTIGKTIGENELDKIRAYTKTLQAIFVLIGIVSGVLVYASIDAVLSFYAISASAIEITKSFLLVTAVAIIGTCYEYPVEGGIIAGGGSTAYQAWVDNLFMWLFTIPFAALSAFVFCFPPVITFCFLKADQLLKCIPNAIVCNRYRWVKILTKTGDRELADEGASEQ